MGDYKAHFITQGAYGELGKRINHEIPLLYNLSHDAAEKFDVAAAHPEIILQIQELVTSHTSKLISGKDQLADRE